MIDLYAIFDIVIVGLRALGFNVVFSVAVAAAFHVLHASYWTSVLFHHHRPFYNRVFSLSKGTSRG